MDKNVKRKKSAAILSVISNTSLVIIKLIAGVITGSVGIISEAIHSGIDLAASLIAYYSIKIAAIPPDEDHKFGHGKFEDMSGLAEAILIFVASFFILNESVQRLLDDDIHHIQTGLGIIVMAISCITNFFVSQYLFKVAKETDSIALEADGKHLQTDVFTSLGVLISLIIISFTGYVWIDAVSAILIGLLIAYMAYKLVRKAFNNLVDIALPEEEEQIIRDILAKYSDEIVSIHRFATRKSGSKRIINFHLMIDGNLTINQGHLLCDLIEEDIKSHFDDSMTSIHIEPCTDDCESCHLQQVAPNTCQKRNNKAMENF